MSLVVLMVGPSPGHAAEPMAPTWLLPELQDATVKEAVASLLKGDAGQALTTLQTAQPAADGTEGPSATTIQGLRALLLASVGKPREAFDATTAALATSRTPSRDRIRVLVLRASMQMASDPMGAYLNAGEAALYGETAFGSSHPATGVARVLRGLAATYAFQGPDPLVMGLGVLEEARTKMPLLQPNGSAMYGADDYVAASLLFAVAGDIQMRRKQYPEARRLFERSGIFAKAISAKGEPAALRLVMALSAVGEDRALASGSVAAAYANDAKAATDLQAEAMRRAYQLGGLQRAAWMTRSVLQVATSLGSCEAMEALVSPGVPGRDGQQLRAVQAKLVGTCWSVVGKDPIRGQPFFDTAEQCAAGDAKCTP